MDGHTNPQPDVAALLRSLTAYLPSGDDNSGSQQAASVNQQQQQLKHPYPANGQYSYSHDHPQPQQRLQPQTTHSGPVSEQYRPSPASVTQAYKPAPRAALADASTITTWPVALRHVMKLSATNQDFIPKLRALIRNQNVNEKQWWGGRQALIQQQAARVGGQKDLDDVLSSIGIQGSGKVEAEDHEAELQRYDVKVHKAQVAMVQALTQELRDLGIPFFGTGRSGGQLLELQRKMIAFLEEFCQE